MIFLISFTLFSKCQLTNGYRSATYIESCFPVDLNNDDMQFKFECEKRITSITNTCEFNVVLKEETYNKGTPTYNVSLCLEIISGTQLISEISKSRININNLFKL